MQEQIQLNPQQQSMLRGERGLARQMAMRLLLDMTAAAGATALVPITSAHLSGVSPLTGGLGLRQFLSRLTTDPTAEVAVPTTLNSAGCDESQFAEMRISAPDFLDHHQEIVAQYTRLGVRAILSCTPYEWDGVITNGAAAWAESNAICFGNSYCGLQTNRESGLSALACALTGYAPLYGLLTDEARRPNLEVTVTVALHDPADFSILGDWIGKQRKNHWRMPYGPIPLITGLVVPISHEQKKALAAAAANYGCPLLYLTGDPHPPGDYQDRLEFSASDLALRYEQLRPRTAVSLIVIGCPQASAGELREVARLLRGRRVNSQPGDAALPPLWVFTSAANEAVAAKIGLAEVIRGSGALLLKDTCPEVVPYDKTWVKHVLTNSMKAEHYIKSGLNGIPTSVMRLEDCIAVASGDLLISLGDAADGQPVGVSRKYPGAAAVSDPRRATGTFSASGSGLPSQEDFVVRAEAFVSAAPLTFLGYVNRETGVVQEPGHPRDGQSMAGKVAIFPRGTGSSVAPYVLLELFYRGMAPAAIVNTDIDQQTAPACSLESIPYAFNFNRDIFANINHGDVVELARKGEIVTVTVIERTAARP